MVRFKRYWTREYNHQKLQSQFHYGSIQTNIVDENSRKIEELSQFHYGSIQTGIN